MTILKNFIYFALLSFSLSSLAYESLPGSRIYVPDESLQDLPYIIQRAAIVSAKVTNEDKDFGTAFFIGIHGTDLVLATSHDIFPEVGSCEGASVEFTYLAKLYECKKVLYSTPGLALISIGAKTEVPYVHGYRWLTHEKFVELLLEAQFPLSFNSAQFSDRRLFFLGYGYNDTFGGFDGILTFPNWERPSNDTFLWGWAQPFRDASSFSKGDAGALVLDLQHQEIIGIVNDNRGADSFFPDIKKWFKGSTNYRSTPSPAWQNMIYSLINFKVLPSNESATKIMRELPIANKQIEFYLKLRGYSLDPRQNPNCRIKVGAFSEFSQILMQLCRGDKMDAFPQNINGRDIAIRLLYISLKYNFLAMCTENSDCKGFRPEPFLKSEDLDEIIQTFESLPEKMRQILVTEELSTQKTLSTTQRIYPVNSGDSFTTNQGEIALGYGWRLEKRRLERRTILTHELAHKLETNLEATNSTFKNQWQLIWQSENGTSRYATANWQEGFAEAVTAYIYNSSDLKARSPKAYTFVGSLLK